MDENWTGRDKDANSIQEYVEVTWIEKAKDVGWTKEDMDVTLIQRVWIWM